MLPRVQLRIPDQYYKGLALILGLSDSSEQELINALSDVQPTLSRRAHTSRVIERVSIDPGEVEEILDVLLSLYSVRVSTDMDIPQFVDVLVRAMKETGDKQLEIDEASRNVVENRLKTFLSFDRTVGVASKSNFLMGQNENILLDARIITDIRPIFSDDIDAPPVGGLIVHSLKISFRSDGETKDLFISIDADDINKLRTLLNRAESKATSLRSLLKSTPMSLLEGET